MQSPAQKAIVIGMDGAAMELVQNMVDWGHMPHLAQLMERGVKRPMIGVFPTLWTRYHRTFYRGCRRAGHQNGGNAATRAATSRTRGVVLRV